MGRCRVAPAALLALAAVLFAASDAMAESAKAAVARYMKTTRAECHDWDRRKPRPCPLSKASLGVTIAEGRVPGEDARYAVAFIDHEDGDGGNMVMRHTAVLVEEQGRWRFLRRIEDGGYGSNPRDFAFLEGGRFEYTATTMREGDPRCCPSGTERLGFPLRADIPPAVPAAAAPTAARSATIEGPFRYPSDYIPPMLKACAENLDTKETICSAKQVQLKGKGKRKETGFRLSVPAGRYHVYATLPPESPEFESYKDYRAYYSEFVPCGYDVSCPSHAPIVVTVEAGKMAGGIEPGDWYANK